jgi:hypothetical protein
MSFEGLPRPVPRMDAFNPYLAGSLARADRLHASPVEPLSAEEALKALEREPENPSERNQDDEEQEQNNNGELLTPEEISDLSLMAKKQGIDNFSVESGTRFEFRVNSLSGLVELVVANSGELILELSGQDLLRFSHKINRYAGVLTDRKG